MAKPITKKIVYTAVDRGIDGMDKAEVLYASFDEDELKKMHGRDESRAWRAIEEEIVHVEKVRKKALAKLDGVERLVLGLPSWLEER